MTELQACRRSRKGRDTSTRVRNPEVHERGGPPARGRGPPGRSPFAARRTLQRQALKLPPFPTTTIGSFPQTPEIRKARAAWAKGELSDADYETG